MGLKQSLVQSSYVLFVFNLLSHYCASAPSLTSSTRAGKLLYGVQFFTRSLPCFTELYSLFYCQKTKVIPVNNLRFITPIALAHLIMGDGESRTFGLVLCTNSFTVKDVVRLMNVLIIRYRIECLLRLKSKITRSNTWYTYVKLLCLFYVLLLHLICIRQCTTSLK